LFAVLGHSALRARSGKLHEFTNDIEIPITWNVYIRALLSFESIFTCGAKLVDDISRVLRSEHIKNNGARLIHFARQAIGPSDRASANRRLVMRSTPGCSRLDSRPMTVPTSGPGHRNRSSLFEPPAHQQGISPFEIADRYIRWGADCPGVRSTSPSRDQVWRQLIDSGRHALLRNEFAFRCGPPSVKAKTPIVTTEALPDERVNSPRLAMARAASASQGRHPSVGSNSISIEGGGPWETH
jgi:hypothetical protein